MKLAVNITQEEKNEYNSMLKLLLSYKIDCRRFNNIRMVFLMEDKQEKCKHTNKLINLNRETILSII